MGFLLDRESNESYARQVVRQAAAQLVAGRLHPGDRLPSVRRLARELGISRSTSERIHEALCDSMLADVRPRVLPPSSVTTPPGVFLQPRSPASVCRRTPSRRALLILIGTSACTRRSP